MMKQTAGILAYRWRAGAAEIFLVHPGGPYWTHKDVRAWSIPKGEFENEEPLLAAQREFLEETGQHIHGDFVAVPPLPGPRKTLHAFLIESDTPDPSNIHSNTFPLQWPPKSGQVQHFPEVDTAAWFSIGEASQKLHKHQLPLIETLTNYLKNSR